MCPVGAASWWASTTSVRRASGSPALATTFQVRSWRWIRLRASRGPLEMSSAMAAPAAAATTAAGARRPRTASDAMPAAAPASDSPRMRPA